jgi:hypothetical protein
MKTPWTDPVPTGARVFARAIRFPGRAHPRAVVAIESPFSTGYRTVHLTRPVAYNCRDGMPAWLRRAVLIVSAHVDGSKTLSDLASIAEAAHRGRGVPRAR